MSSRGAGARAPGRVVYSAGLVQGIVLVTFPAASTIFTSASAYGLSSSQYGGMFLPQAITAVGSSLLEGNLSHRLGGKPVYLAGLCANLAAMLLLIASRFVHGQPGGRIPAAAGGHRVPGGGLRAHGAVDQHLHRRVPPGRGGPVGAGAELAPRAGDRARPGVRGDLRGPGLLGRPAGPGRGRGHRPAPGQPAAAAGCRGGPRPGPEPGRLGGARRSRPRSGCSRGSRCCTGSARP